MDWIVSFLGFLLKKFASAAQVVDQYLGLIKVVMVGVAVLLVLALALARSKR
jgi:hypothetical protein